MATHVLLSVDAHHEEQRRVAPVHDLVASVLEERALRRSPNSKPAITNSTHAHTHKHTQSVHFPLPLALFIIRTHLQLRARQALADDLGLERGPLVDGHPLIVVGQAGLALLVHHQDELDHLMTVPVEEWISGNEMMRAIN